MATNKETLLRQWQMLRLIPRYPAKLSARDLQDRLAGEDFKVSKRTIERDLLELSEFFPITVDDRDRPYGWSWAKNAEPFDLPGLGTSEALSFALVEKFLRPLLPGSTLEHLAPYFRMSAQRLASSAGKGNAWTDKVRAVPPGQPLLPPRIKPEIQAVVYEALLTNSQLALKYQKRGEAGRVEYTAHPLGLVQRGAVLYLVCTLYQYEDIRILPLHRILAADLLNEAARRPKGFNLDGFIATGAFGFDVGDPIALEALFAPEAADHLFETPISADQELVPVKDGRLRLTATVIHTSQLEWWLLAFGSLVEVVGPEKLRARIRDELKQASEGYE